MHYTLIIELPFMGYNGLEFRPEELLELGKVNKQMMIKKFI